MPDFPFSSIIIESLVLTNVLSGLWCRPIIKRVVIVNYNSFGTVSPIVLIFTK